MKTTRAEQPYHWILTVGGLLGLVAMTWQASERITMLKNPTASLNCNLSPVIDCGTVLSNRLAALFGFPNAFIGMSLFAMIALAGIAGLTGVLYTQKFKNVVLALSTILIIFSMWFFGASLYYIGKVCIFCAVGWVVSVPVFIYSLIDWLQCQQEVRKKQVHVWLSKNVIGMIIIWYALLICLFLYRFREYYFR